MYLGIDPGKHGAAAIVAIGSTGPRLLRAWWWHPLRTARGYGVRSLHAPDGLYSWASLAELGDQLPLCAGVALEGLYMGRAGSQVIGTAETAGELLGAVLATQRAEIQRPLATQWRAAVLALPGRTSAQQADRYAKSVCESVFGASEAWKSGHAVDAACLALWAAGVRGVRK